MLTVQKGQPGTAATASIGKTMSPPRSPAKPLPAADASSSSTSERSLKPSASVKPLSPPNPAATLQASKPRPVRTDSEVPEGTVTTAAANRKLPVNPPLLDASKTAQNTQPARNARPQQPFAPPIGSTAPSGAKPGLTSSEGAHVKVDGGWMVLRVVPDDKYVALPCITSSAGSREVLGSRTMLIPAYATVRACLQPLLYCWSTIKVVQYKPSEKVHRFSLLFRIVQ